MPLAGVLFTQHSAQQRPQAARVKIASQSGASVIFSTSPPRKARKTTPCPACTDLRLFLSVVRRKDACLSISICRGPTISHLPSNFILNYAAGQEKREHGPFSRNEVTDPAEKNTHRILSRRQQDSLETKKQISRGDRRCTRLGTMRAYHWFLGSKTKQKPVLPLGGNTDMTPMGCSEGDEAYHTLFTITQDHLRGKQGDQQRGFAMSGTPIAACCRAGLQRGGDSRGPDKGNHRR